MFHKTVIKHLAILISTSIILYCIHNFIITTYLEVGNNDLILKQHIFLCSAVLFVYGSSVAAHKITPKNTGFIFLGLVMAKMMIAGLFIYQLGWLDDPNSMPKRSVFLIFYFIYSFTLVYNISRLLKIFSDKSTSE
ncbi:hypothetical protein [Aquimarina longa]|uniref:hypothetical protein n=1 Tax=Aquimarina longa TaxID=1080221 RepID=UPI00078034D5|nr:hypothetical protein [Aquimarina longa]